MSDRQIPNGSAHWFVTRMLEMNVDCVRLFDSTDLSPDWPEKPSSTISQQQYLQIVDNALEETGDPALGLNIGRSQTLCELGFWGYAIISSPTLGDAEDISLQYWEVMGNLIEISRKEDKNYFEWSLYRPFPMKTTRQWRYAVEELLSIRGCVLWPTAMSHRLISLFHFRNPSMAICTGNFSNAGYILMKKQTASGSLSAI